MDDLERAILFNYDPCIVGADPAVRSQAIDFCNHLKTSSPSDLIRLCFDRLHHSPHVPVKFWCVQSLHETVTLRYSALSPDDLSLLRSSLLSLFSDRPLPSSSPPFLKNKLSQALAALIGTEYPSSWPSPFLHLLSHLPTAGTAAIDMFSRVLVALDDCIISQDYVRSPSDAAVATRLKDAMRHQCIPQIARAWFDIVFLYHSSDPDLAVGVLEAMRRYTAWIDIGLVANDAFLSFLFDLILSPSTLERLSSAAAGCVVSIFSKGMDSRSKLNLLNSLRMNRVLSNPGLVGKFAAMVICYASEVLECYKKLVFEKEEGPSTAMELLEEALPSVFYVTQNCDKLEYGNVVHFLSDCLSTVKSPSEKQMVYIAQILEAIRAQISYDPTYRCNLNSPDKIGMEEEDRISEHRKEWFALFRSVCRVAPDITQLFIQNLIASALSSSEMDMEEVEAALTMFYWLGETLSEEGIKSYAGLSEKMVPMLLSGKFACHSHRLVALVYLETITKYTKFVQDNSQCIPDLLAAFLDERGINHPNPLVSRRATYLFMKAVKRLKAKLVPFIDAILRSVQDALVRYTSLDWSSGDLRHCGSEDGSHAFEAIGLLIGMEDVLPEKQAEFLAALLKPLYQQVEAVLLEVKTQGIGESSPQIMNLQHIIAALNALSKGFSERTVTTSRPVIGQLFKQTLDALLQTLFIFPNIKSLRKKIISFIHRMVEILGTSMVPYLPMTFNQLLVDNEPNDIVDLLLLINQVICKFGNSVESILEEIFPILASRLFGFLSNEGFSFGSECNTEICVQIFIKLIKDWCSKYSDEEKVPGFGNFIIEKFATNCCLYSVLDKSLEFHDANTLVLLGEIVLAQKVMYEKLGDDFLVHFVSKGLLTAHCPHDLAEQYYANVQGNDVKALKSFYLYMIEILRQQQNASLVFR
ncbi:exportin-T-like isoform X2 [Phalaenopsis equestris]|uniref:exportin-T-like isoform X2 n=1 Tax=Phalaenopsis equestris TaxID=78828 RepID=UPI0009E45EFF|nr:exportin-T-like isoform X2 [Phalaenopsis equestris]